MADYITQDGNCYSAAFQLSPSDAVLPPRPSTQHIFVNGSWVDRAYVTLPLSEVETLYRKQSHIKCDSTPTPTNCDCSTHVHRVEINPYHRKDDTRYGILNQAPPVDNHGGDIREQEEGNDMPNYDRQGRAYGYDQDPRDGYGYRDPRDYPQPRDRRDAFAPHDDHIARIVSDAIATAMRGTVPAAMATTPAATQAAPPPPPANGGHDYNKDSDGSLIFGSNSKVKLGIKEVFSLAILIAGVAVSWSETNGRLVKVDEMTKQNAAAISAISTDFRNFKEEQRDQIQKLKDDLKDTSNIILQSRGRKEQ